MSSRGTSRLIPTAVRIEMNQDGRQQRLIADIPLTLQTGDVVESVYE